MCTVYISIKTGHANKPLYCKLHEILCEFSGYNVPFIDGKKRDVIRKFRIISHGTLCGSLRYTYIQEILIRLKD